MELGNVVEFIDRQKILCAVILEIKKLRLRLLTEANREVKLSANRLSHKCNSHLDLSLSRDKLVEALKQISNRRKALINHIDIKELWEILNSEQEWIDLETMTEFCFPENPTDDHESAVVRAFFDNRLYFKFNGDRFFPYTEEQVDQLDLQIKEKERIGQFIESGANWLKHILNNNQQSQLEDLNGEERRFVEILKSCYLFENDSEHYHLGGPMLKLAGIENSDKLFELFTKLGVWGKDENLELIKHDVPTEFSEHVRKSTERLVKEAYYTNADNGCDGRRRNLTELPLITIDGQATLDFDDALSIEKIGNHYHLGVHISDVGHYIKRDGSIDVEAHRRASSIYTPDQKIPMIPPSLAEGLCSLKSGEMRPAISVLIHLDASAEILDVEVVASLIQVKRQLTYYDVNTVAEEDEEIQLLYDIAKKFRQKRLSQGALQITLPEINIWVNSDGRPHVSRINRESPGRMLVSELMIMANWLMADFLQKNNTPAIFRSQPGPRDRLYKNNEGTLFQNWMQRKLLNRFALGSGPEHHSGLGVAAYVTATSPIRKYFDLVTQRQIRAVLGLDVPYTKTEIEHLIQSLGLTMGTVSRIQYARQRYWLLKHLETKIGDKTEAIVLTRRRNNYTILLNEYMMECSLPLSSGVNLKPEDLVQVKIQYANARNDMIAVYMG
jgi:exoribonuclease-2